MTRQATAWTLRVETPDRDWRHRAVCARVDPETFFPIDTGDDAGARISAAKRVCAGCPVRSTCLNDVMGWEDPADGGVSSPA
jgi:Transcription factor WhiB.